MRNFNNNKGEFKNFNDRGSARNFGRSRGGFGENRNSDRLMYDAVCDKCGHDCQVPFQPTGEKPVYCNDCFEQTISRGGGKRRFESRDVKDYQQDNLRLEIETLNTKVDKILNILLSEKKTDILPEETEIVKKKKQAKKIKNKT